MTFTRKVTRRAKAIVQKLQHAPSRELPDGTHAPSIYESHAAVLAGMRIFDVPPPGAEDDAFADEQRRLRNARKRARRGGS